MGKIKKAFVLFFVAGLLSPITGGFTMLLYSLGVIYVLFGDIAIEAAINLPILLIKLMLFPFTLVFGTFKKTTAIGKGFWHTGIDNIRRNSWKQKNRRDDGDDDDEDESAVGYIKEAFSLMLAPITKFKLRYGFVLLFFIWVLGYPEIFSTVMADPTQVIELDNIFMIFLLGLPFILTVVFSSFMGQVFGDYKKFWEWGDSGIGEAAEGIAGTVGAATASVSAPSAKGAAEAAKEGAGDFKDIKGYGQKGAKGVQKGTQAVAKKGASMAEGTALEGALQGTVFESIGAAGGGIITAWLLVVLAVIFYAGVLAVVGSLVGALTWGWFNFALPFFAEPIMGALGLGGAYAQWFGESTANTVGPQIGGVFEEEIRMLRQGFAKVQCFTKGPQCIRQWQMNNTVRPGSEAEGETYELRIEQFGIGRDRIDKAYKRAEYNIPVNFLVENTRHGLKGINARNVEYKIDLESYEETHCSTGWKEIDSFPGQERDLILPGLGVSPTDTGDLEDLTLGNCGLLQPSMGEDRVLSLDVKYDYASQATLYVDAMARDYRREKGIKPSFEKSRTARTPVQSYINVKSPVTFFESENGGRQAVPFPARFGFETPGYDVEYKVHPESVDIRDSSRTTHVEGNCEGLEHEGNNEYKVSEQAKDRIELRQDDNWFTANVDPAPLRCTMKIEDGSRPDIGNDLPMISPTGEQLVMRIDGNYTVKREQQMQSFDVWNTRCTEYRCPLVVTEEYAQESEYDLFSECTAANSVDTRDGCHVRVPESSGDIEWQNVKVAKKDGDRIKLEQGETAHRWEFIWGEMNTNYPPEKYSTIIGDGVDDSGRFNGAPIYGVNEGELDRAMNSDDGAVIFREANSDKLQYESIEHSVCQQEPNVNEFKDIWKEDNGADEVVLMRVLEVDCQQMLEDLSTSADCPVDLAAEVVQTGTGWNTFVEGGGLLGDTDTACDEIDRMIDGCDEGEIRAVKDGTFVCYG